MFALIDSGRLKLTGDLTTISLELRVGPIRVDIEAQDGVVKNIVMSQQKPQFLRTYAPEEVMPVFGLTVDDVLPGTRLQTVSTGTPQLMIPVRDLGALRRVSVNPLRCT